MEIYKFKDIKSKFTLKRVIILVIILIVLLFLILYKFCYPFRQLANNIWSITPQINLNVSTIYIEDENINGIVGCDKYLSVLSQNKLLTYTTKENAESENSIKVTNMLSATKGKYLAIAQKGSSELYLFNGGNLKYEINAKGNISQISVNKNGYVAVSIEKSGHRSVVVLYNPEGKEVFTTFLVNNYANGIRISDNNKYLAFAEIDTSGIKPISKIKFIQIDKVSTENYTIDTEKEENVIISKLEFVNNNEIIYMANDEIKKVNTNGEKTQILSLSNSGIENVDISLEKAIVIVEKTSNGLLKSNNSIKIYDTSGKLISSYDIQSNIKQVIVKDNMICANVGKIAYFITSSGRLIKKYENETDIKNVVIYDNGVMAAIVYRNKIELVYV